MPQRPQPSYSAEQVTAFNELQRNSITPENAAAILSALGDIDIREDAKLCARRR